MDYVTQTINQGQVPKFLVLDESQDNSFEPINCCFHLNDKMKVHEINMLGSPYNFHKILVLLDYIDKYLACKDNDFHINKRGVYYSLIGQGIKSTDELDDYITQICQLLETSRSNLGIIASTKGLISGGGLTSLKTIEYLQIPAYMANASNYDEFDLNIDFIIVVEKESVFAQLI